MHIYESMHRGAAILGNGKLTLGLSGFVKYEKTPKKEKIIKPPPPTYEQQTRIPTLAEMRNDTLLLSGKKTFGIGGYINSEADFFARRRGKNQPKLRRDGLLL